MKNLRVLVFSASFGAGHVRAAEATIEALRNKDSKVEIDHLDFGAFLSKTFNSVIKSTYIELIKHTPKLWGKFYYKTAKIPPDSVLQRFLNKLGRTEFVKYIKALKPDLIICTYPTVAGVLAELRQKKVLDVPLVTIVTDFAVHSQWIHSGVDLYIVGCDDVYQGLVDRGIDPERIRVTGIPVSPKFEVSLNRQEILAKLGLKSDYPIVLVMGGAYGVLGGAKEVCKTLAESPTPVQSIVVCGRDEKLYRAVDEIAREAQNPVVRYGFIKNVEELMTAADLIITKAGGLTVSEALTKQLPLLIFKPIPGQEEENANFVNRLGAGTVASNPDELEQVVRYLLSQPEKLAHMSRAAKQALPGNAAEQAVEHMLKLVKSEMTQKIG